MTLKTKNPKVTTFLWFQKDAEAAARFYVSLFPRRAKVLGGNPMSTRFRIDGQEFVAFNGGPHLSLTPAASLFVECNDQKEVDRLWKALTSGGGQESRCGWLVDRFGLSWQIVPRVLPSLIFDNKHPEKAKRAMAAMMGMGKLVIAELEAAYEG